MKQKFVNVSFEDAIDAMCLSLVLKAWIKIVYLTMRSSTVV